MFKMFTRVMAPEGDDAGKGDEGSGEGDAGDQGTGDAGKGNDKQTIMGSGDAGDQGTDDQDGEWSWAENIKGDGIVPPWLKTDKFKTVADQAKGFKELEAKIGPAAEMLGAPEGDYELTPIPDGTEGEWDTDDPMLAAFNTVAKDIGLSQVAHDKVVQAMGALLAQEQSDAETQITDALAALGTNSAARITAVDKYLTATLGEEGFDSLQNAVGTDVKAYLALEKLVGVASGDAQLSSLPGKQGPGFSKSDIEAEQYKKFPAEHKLAGQSMYDTDKAHRAKVDAMWKELYPGEDRQEVG